jgi:glycosyltransferase involved in cell wall biosynthesis
MPGVPPKILFLSHDSSRTGAPIGLLAFTQWLRRHTNYGFGIILRVPGPLEAAFRELGPTLTLNSSFLARSRFGRRLRRRMPRRIRMEAGKIQKFCSDGGYDLIYSNTMMNGGVLDCIRPLRIPVVTHVHELAYWLSRENPEHLRRVIQATNSYIAVSQAVRQNLVGNHSIAEAKITVIPEHIRELPALPTLSDRTSARASLGIAENAFVVGGCGAEHWRKGRDLIPQLLLALRRQWPEREVHFVWIGRGGTAEEEFTLRFDLRNGGVERFFHATGELPNPFLLFPAIDVFALLSRDDPYPLACLEVAALEKPVVCFADAGGMPEFVHDGCGLVAPYLDVESMARDIIRLAQDPALSLACGRRARIKVAGESTLGATAPQLLAAIDRALGTR